MEVPFLDLKAHHTPLRDEFSEAINRVIDAGEFAGGSFVKDFEEVFAHYCGTSHAVGVGSGTDALWLALLAHGVGPGDEVITVPMTFIATAEAISRTGASPVFVDIEATTYTMDPQALEKAITPRTKVIVPVHLFGQMADMDPILKIAANRGVRVIEDAAQAHGATYKAARAGSLGIAGCFSFYPGKNLGAFGDAGAVVTDDSNLAGRIRVLRDHGQTRKYCHSVIGWNCRMDGIQAAVLNVKLNRLDYYNQLRSRHAAIYAEAFKKIPGLVLPQTGPNRVHVRNIYALRVPDRRGFMQELISKGIGCGIHYPLPIHLQEAYAVLKLPTGSFPVAEQCAKEFVSLPIYPELSDDQIQRVIAVVEEAALTSSLAGIA
jgi:dTDP-4-amino-4,6-dideoxygalactose transaminase